MGGTMTLPTFDEKILRKVGWRAAMPFPRRAKYYEFYDELVVDGVVVGVISCFVSNPTKLFGNVIDPQGFCWRRSDFSGEMSILRNWIEYKAGATNFLMKENESERDHRKSSSSPREA